MTIMLFYKVNQSQHSDFIVFVLQVLIIATASAIAGIILPYFQHPSLPPPSLMTSPDSVSLTLGTMHPGDSVSKQITLSNAGGGTLEWNVSADQPWITVNPRSGAGLGTVNIDVNTAGLQPGNYSGVITVSSNGGIRSGSISFNLVPPSPSPPILSISNNSFKFANTSTGESKVKILEISNNGGGTLDWRAKTDSPWIELNHASGSNNGSIIVTINTTDLSPGSHAGIITIESNGGTGQVAIELNVPPSMPTQTSPTPTPTPTPTVMPSPTPTPTVMPSPTPTPTVMPSPTPTPTVTPSPTPTLSITANPTTVTVGTATSVTFTVISGGTAVSDATITLSGSATGTGTTDTSGNAVISVNAATAGTITATANKTGYTSGTTTVTANSPTPTPAPSFALQFDGASTYAAIPNAHGNFHFASGITVEAWVKPTAVTPSDGTYHAIISGTDGLPPNWGGMIFSIFQSRNDLTAPGMAISLPSTNSTVSPSGTLAAGSWQHLAGSYDGATIRLYRNGALVGSISHGPGSPSPDPNYILIGIWVKSFNGLIQEVRIWNRTLSDSDIAQNQNKRLTGTEPGLIAYYRLDEGSGQVIHDASGHGNDGTLGSSTSVEASDPTWVSSDLLIQ